MMPTITAPRTIKFYNDIETFKEYKSINDKFWSDISEFISKYGKDIIEKGYYFNVKDFISDNIDHRRILTKIFADKIIRRLYHIKKLNGLFITPCFKENHIDIWFRDNYHILGFNYIRSTGMYPDYKCAYSFELSDILCDNKNAASLQFGFHTPFHNGYEVMAELEYESSNFKNHKHDPDKVDIIICYKKDKDIYDSNKNPVPIIELKEFVQEYTDDDYTIGDMQYFVGIYKELFIENLMRINSGKYDREFYKQKNIEYKDRVLEYIRLHINDGNDNIKNFILNDIEICDILCMFEKNELIIMKEISELTNIQYSDIIRLKVRHGQ